MKNFINDFVETHKILYREKKSHVTPTKKHIIDSIIVVFTMIIVAFIVGYITKSMENLSYVLNILNTITIGSFVLYLYAKEKQNKIKEEHEMNISYLILPRVVNFGIILLASSIAIQLYFMREYISIINVGFIAVLLLALVIFNEYLYTYIKKFEKGRRYFLYRTAFSVFYNMLLFILVIRLLPIKNVMISLTLTYFVVGLIYILKEYMKPIMKPLFGAFIFAGVLIYALMMKEIVYSANRNFNEDKFLFNELFEYRVIQKDISIERKSGDIIRFLEDYYFVVNDNEPNIMYFYSYDKELLRTVDITDTFTPGDRYYYYTHDDTIYIRNQLEDAPYDRSGEIYYLNADYNLVLFGTFHKYSGGFIHNGYLVEDIFGYDFSTQDGEEAYFYDVFGDDIGVFYKTDTLIGITLSEYRKTVASNTFSMHGSRNPLLRYSNDYFYYSNDDENLEVVCTIDQYIDEDFESCIKLSENYSLKVHFYATDEYFIVYYDDFINGFYRYYDHEGNKVIDVDGQGLNYFNDYVSYYEENYTHLSDINTLPVLVVNTEASDLYKVFDVISLLVLVYFVYPSKPLFGGVGYDN